MARSGPERILLVGARGAGKTTIGEALARRLGLPFLDGDREVERASGRGVPELLAAGELRAWEARVLPGLLAEPRAVLSTGGGAVLWEGFVAASRGWRILWLDAAPEVLGARIAAQPGTRPSLTGRPADEEIASVVRERAARYRAVAERRFDTGRDDPGAIVDAIAAFLHSERNGGAETAD